MLNCIDSHFTSAPCRNPAFTKRTHGFLCAGHYRQQQESIPAKPRLPQPKWIGLVQQTDEQIIEDIITSDLKAINTAKRVTVIQRGAVDPIYLTILEE